MGSSPLPASSLIRRSSQAWSWVSEVQKMCMRCNKSGSHFRRCCLSSVTKLARFSTRALRSSSFDWCSTLISIGITCRDSDICNWNSIREINHLLCLSQCQKCFRWVESDFRGHKEWVICRRNSWSSAVSTSKLSALDEQMAWQLWDKPLAGKALLISLVLGKYGTDSSQPVHKVPLWHS